MATNSTRSEVVIYAEKYWGLDPLFRSHCKFYIADVLSLHEAPDKSGVFFYGNHPVLRVDLMGVIVKVIRRQHIIIYSVDDGTGVINCVYWLPTDTDASRGKHELQYLQAVLSGMLLETVRQLEEEMEMLSIGLDLGDLVQIRGKLKCYQDMNQVVAKYIRKVTKPMEEVTRMMELPQLYRTCYNVPFCPPAGTLNVKTAGDKGDTSHMSEVEKVKAIAMAILSHVTKDHIETTGLEQCMMGDLWEVTIANCLHTVDTTRASKLVHTALESLEQDGHLVKKQGNKQDYLVVSQSTSLGSAILEILKRDCPKPKYAIDGCHCLHILDELRKQLLFANVTKNSTQRALDRLEEQSDIISMTEYHYTIFL